MYKATPMGAALYVLPPRVLLGVAFLLNLSLRQAKNRTTVSQYQECDAMMSRLKTRISFEAITTASVLCQSTLNVVSHKLTAVTSHRHGRSHTSENTLLVRRSQYNHGHSLLLLPTVFHQRPRRPHFHPLRPLRSRPHNLHQHLPPSHLQHRHPFIRPKCPHPALRHPRDHLLRHAILQHAAFPHQFVSSLGAAAAPSYTPAARRKWLGWNCGGCVEAGGYLAVVEG